jgi:hypothetical protein
VPHLAQFTPATSVISSVCRSAAAWMQVGGLIHYPLLPINAPGSGDPPWRARPPPPARAGLLATTTALGPGKLGTWARHGVPGSSATQRGRTVGDLRRPSILGSESAALRGFPLRHCSLARIQASAARLCLTIPLSRPQRIPAANLLVPRTYHQHSLLTPARHNLHASPDARPLAIPLAADPETGFRR